MTSDRRALEGTAHDWLHHHLRSRPDASAVAVWRHGAVRAALDFADLSALVDRAASALPRYAPDPGDRVVLALPNDACFTAALLACLAAGLIAVPAPPLTASPTPAVLARLRGIVADCRPALVIGCGGQDGNAWASGPIAGVRHVVAWDDLVTSADGPLRRRRRPTGGEIALLQYTSGSTGTPKGAVITHRAIRASCAQAARAYRESAQDTAVTWVPLHHDMGLVTGVLRPLFSGYASVLLSPQDFARAPLSWLQALTAVRGTLSSAPDFAYRLCVRRVPAAQLPRLDLSSWRVARNAGEVVRADTADRFTEHFRPVGFRSGGFCPSYGMAEATLTVTTSTPEDPPLRLVVDHDALQADRVVPVTDPAEPGRRTSVLLSSGRPLPGTEVAIGGPGGRTERPQDAVGPVWISGPQLFSGYWHSSGPDGSSGPNGGPVDGGPVDGSPVGGAPVDGGPVDGWHATGDLGFVHQGRLFVLGRGDDTVIQNGRNVHASDVRAVCAGIPGLRPGRCVAFTTGGAGSPASEPARVCVVAEVDTATPRPPAELTADVRRQLVDQLELYVHHVELVPRGDLPVTTSGKPVVAGARARFESRTPGAQ
ncbi:fatty acyl-AMP ligase [Streptacidiphilus sp. PB12-B1b]|uniref:AMP-binding protein n=1 Tax=Streptacidiphilus sp. PB12-B1b TaxID=2705012 RepID=UPI0015FBDBE6|nr:AMP-binding protein [Streptacidiphilus sp. PB12-B1b]QMU78227.1 fatty acyl-AMP ligase [Streptacidiphilus sp. PB12-B1b]